MRANLKDLIRGKKCNVRDAISKDEMTVRIFEGDE